MYKLCLVPEDWATNGWRMRKHSWESSYMLGLLSSWHSLLWDAGTSSSETGCCTRWTLWSQILSEYLCPRARWCSLQCFVWLQTMMCETTPEETPLLTGVLELTPLNTHQTTCLTWVRNTWLLICKSCLLQTRHCSTQFSTSQNPKEGTENNTDYT